MGSVFGEYKEKKSDMDTLMDSMRVPVGGPAVFNIQPEPTEMFLVTNEIIQEVINAGEPEIPKISNPFTVGIQRRMRQLLGVDLAGYFKVEVHNRPKDSVVNLLFKASTLGIGVGKGANIAEAWKDAVVSGMIPSLKSLREDVDKLISLLPNMDYA